MECEERLRHLQHGHDLDNVANIFLLFLVWNLIDFFFLRLLFDCRLFVFVPAQLKQINKPPFSIKFRNERGVHYDVLRDPVLAKLLSIPKSDKRL